MREVEVGGNMSNENSSMKIKIHDESCCKNAASMIMVSHGTKSENTGNSLWIWWWSRGWQEHWCNCVQCCSNRNSPFALLQQHMRLTRELPDLRKNTDSAGNDNSTIMGDITNVCNVANTFLPFNVCQEVNLQGHILLQHWQCKH